MDWYPQQLFTALQAAAGVFCFCFNDIPFLGNVYLCQKQPFVVNIWSISATICQC